MHLEFKAYDKVFALPRYEVNHAPTVRSAYTPVDQQFDTTTIVVDGACLGSIVPHC